MSTKLTLLLHIVIMCYSVLTWNPDVLGVHVSTLCPWRNLKTRFEGYRKIEMSHL